MPRFRGRKSAFGGPGLEPWWSPATKQGIGTAWSLGSRVWFTVCNGILTEIYYPHVDRPQVRDVQFVFADGDRLFLDETRDFEHEIARIEPAQGYRITSRDRHGRFQYVKEIIADPRRASVLMRTQLKGDDSFLRRLRVYLLCAPHMENGGEANNGYVIEVAGREFPAAEKHGRWMLAGGSCRFAKLSCGYVGQSDGYTDLKNNRRMTFDFDEAKNGNVALTGELELGHAREFTVAISFGESMAHATSTLLQSLGGDYEKQRSLFLQRWEGATREWIPLEKESCDGGRLYRSSCNIILSHEDKSYQGAFVASLTVPWGEARNDQDGRGGYHLVWTRDMVQSALGLLAAGNKEAPARVLIYLAARQEEDGGFPQNFRVNGEPFKKATQLDEIAFPVILAWRLKQEGLIDHFNPGTMVRRAINYLILKGPVTAEERWEEASGYSPSTLAAIISASVCASSFERSAGETEIASFLESYADFLLAHLFEWTVTSQGYFVRVNPVKPGKAASPGDLDEARVTPTKQETESDSIPAADVMDAGFLQLVRYGILAPHHPAVVKSLQKVDKELKADLPAGPCWRRYTHDGYGQRPDGSPFKKWGRGRPWPLLTGERGHYELSAGRNCRSFIQAMEGFGGSNCLLPEQIWDEKDIPQANLRRGGPAGSATPLVWAHSEYIRLLRSYRDGKVFDLIPEVAGRYSRHPPQSRIEFWMPQHPISHARKKCILRICSPEAFRLRWRQKDRDDWQDGESGASGVGAEYFDIPEAAVAKGVEFTFFWKARKQWEGRNYQIEAAK